MGFGGRVGIAPAGDAGFVFSCGCGNPAFFSLELPLFDLALDLWWDILSGDFPVIRGFLRRMRILIVHDIIVEVWFRRTRRSTIVAPSFKAVKGSTELSAEFVLDRAGFWKGD